MSLKKTKEEIMRILKIILSCSLVTLFLVACGSSSAQKWAASEMAGLSDPGFTITNKSFSSSEVRYTFSNLSDQKVSDFLSVLYVSEFISNQNYIAETTYISYAGTNPSGESLHFIYNISEKTGVLVYGIASGNRFVGGLRDMGYWIQSNYEYASNDDYSKYKVMLWYNVVLNVSRTNYLEMMTSCKMSNFKIKSNSQVGSLSFGVDPWAEAPLVFTKNCNNLGDINFVVRQVNIGTYPITMDSSPDKSAFFTEMKVSQSDLNFTISFTVDIETDKGSYSKDYEITVLPSGFDTTKMSSNQYLVDQGVTDILSGIPYTKK
jgi:hypothetical protein